MLKIPTQQKEFIIDFPDTFKNIAIKMSGGTDSSIMAFMLASYKSQYRPDIELHAITMNHPLKPFQIPFSKQVISWIEEQFGFQFASHTTGTGTASGNYADEQGILVRKSYVKYNIDAHFMGQTSNPIDYKENQLLIDQWDYRCEERDIEMKDKLQDTDYVSSEYLEFEKEDILYRGYYPFVWVDKKCIAELYDYFNITDTLLPLTRSCEKETTDFSHHCGQCWWCAEREYGFGRLV